METNDVNVETKTVWSPSSAKMDSTTSATPRAGKNIFPHVLPNYESRSPGTKSRIMSIHIVYTVMANPVVLKSIDLSNVDT